MNRRNFLQTLGIGGVGCAVVKPKKSQFKIDREKWRRNGTLNSVIRDIYMETANVVDERFEMCNLPGAYEHWHKHMSFLEEHYNNVISKTTTIKLKPLSWRESCQNTVT